MKVRHALLAAVTVVLVTAATSPHAGASCVGPYGPGGAPIAAPPNMFVGTVTATGNGERTATVHVEEIWRGRLTSGEVTMLGSPVSGLQSATDVDRHYQLGARYLFMPYGDSSPFDDNSCSGTTLLTSDVERQRPADAQVVAAPAAVGSTTPGTPALVVAAMVVLIPAVAGWMRLRRHAAARGRRLRAG